MQKIEMQSEVRSNRLHLMVTTGANRFNFKIEFCSSLTDAMIKKMPGNQGSGRNST